MIENYFLYKTALIRLFFKYVSYQKRAETEKIKVAILVINFSIMGETIVKVRGPRLKFWYVVALMTTHFLCVFFWKILSEDDKIFLYKKWNTLWFHIKYVIFTNVSRILLDKITIWAETNNIFEISDENWGRLCLFQRFLFTFFFSKISPW